MLNKKVKKKYIFIVITLILVSILFYFMIFGLSKNGIELGLIEKVVNIEVRNLISEFNARKKDDIKHKYKLWSANFSNGSIPTPNTSDEYIDIIWLGGNKTLNITGIEKFDIILTSTPLLAKTLRNNNLNAYYLPLGNYYAYNNKLMNNKDDFFAIIGNPPFIEDVLKKRNLEYRVYSLKDKDKIINDMHNFRAVFTINTEIHKHSSDLHPLYFIFSSFLGQFQ